MRTHEWQPAPNVVGRRCSAAQTLELNKRILELHAKGMKNWEIADALKVSRPTVGAHVNGQISTARKGKRRQ